MQCIADSISIMATLPPAGTATLDESRLVTASRDGDPDAFEQLVRLHQHRVFRLSGRFFKRREDVEDAAQETFLTAWRKLSTYRGEAPFEHWLTCVCLNTCYQRLRVSRVDVLPLEDVAAPSAPQPDPNAAIEVERLFLGKRVAVDPGKGRGIEINSRHVASPEP